MNMITRSDRHVATAWTPRRSNEPATTVGAVSVPSLRSRGSGIVSQWPGGPSGRQEVLDDARQCPALIPALQVVTAR